MIGTVLGGRYEITENIDSGGMAYVYKAICKKTQNIVAVKVLKQKFADSTEYVNRFKKEAQAAFSLDHQHIVKVTDVGFDEGVYYLVMEYIEGPSLKAVIEAGKGLSEKQSIDYAIQICSALAAAHKKGIVHRDIKPQNILIDKDGLVKITDFGIAKSISSADESDNKVIGSVYYISPEQAKGDRVDGRSDIYSLGIVLYEMLTGTLPFIGEKTVSVALKHINEQITPPADRNESVSKSANNIVLKATGKTKRSRYRNMNEFKEDLMRALVEKDGAFVDINLSITTIAKPKNTRKNKIWKISILVALAAVVAVAAIFGADIFSPDEQEMMTVPDLVGQTSAMAAQVLREQGFEIEITEEESNTVPEGVIISQTPEHGVQVPENETVYLFVSGGPGDLVMPDVYGLSVVEAVVLIEDMELVIEEFIYEESEEVLPDIVLAQVPDAGETVVPGDVVNLIVSTEIIQTAAVMPEVDDMPLDQAVSMLTDSGFVNIFVYQEENDAEPGSVISQSPEQGTQVPYDSDIDLWISQYIDRTYFARLIKQIEIPEIESKVRIVAEELAAGVKVNFVMLEPEADAGQFLIDLPIACQYGGIKTIKVYINNVVEYIFEIEATERRDFGQG